MLAAATTPAMRSSLLSMGQFVTCVPHSLIPFLPALRIAGVADSAAVMACGDDDPYASRSDSHTGGAVVPRQASLTGTSPDRDASTPPLAAAVMSL